MYSQKTHKPVLLKECIEHLKVQKNGFYIDCTLGEGGHSFEIYKLLNEEGVLLSLDQDQEAIRFVTEHYKDQLGNPDGPKWIIKNLNFEKIDVATSDIQLSPNGILMDIGLSSRQIDVEDRGFSYQEMEQDLDMRMDLRLGLKASDLLNALTAKQLQWIFGKFGEEKYSGRIAEAIKRTPQPITKVGELVDLIYRVMPPGVAEAQHKNPARRVFQALRIAVNDELGALEKGIEKSFNLLAPKGVLSVITFHSLEDRIVKQFMRKKCDSGLGEMVSRKPVVPSEQEQVENPRSVSAKLRSISRKS